LTTKFLQQKKEKAMLKIRRKIEKLLNDVDRIHEFANKNLDRIDELATRIDSLEKNTKLLLEEEKPMKLFTVIFTNDTRETHCAHGYNTSIDQKNVWFFRYEKGKKVTVAEYLDKVQGIIVRDK
jgi:predicted RNase H-like nuclease (RuvC/YqgF family)